MVFKQKIWAVIMLLMCFSVVLAQDQKEAKETKEGKEISENILKVNTTLVNVPVIATNKEGLYLSNLKKEDFLLYEDGVKQDVEVFFNENSPTNILILMGANKNNKRLFSSAQTIAKIFVSKMRDSDNVAILSYDKNSVISSKFSNNKAELFQIIDESIELENIKLKDIVAEANKEILKNINNRKILIVISDGMDTNSRHSEKEVLNQLIESDTIIYSFFYPSPLKVIEANQTPMGTAYSWRNSDDGGQAAPGFFTVLSNEDDLLKDGFLKQLSEKSGGKFFNIVSNKVDRNIQEIIDELAHIYILGYYPTNSSEKSNKKKIKVKLEEKKAKLRYKTVYQTNK